MDELRIRNIDLQILKELSKRPSVTFRELFYSLKLDESYLSKRLKLLRSNGFVERTGWGQYSITPKGLNLISQQLNLKNYTTVLQKTLDFSNGLVVSSKIDKKKKDENLNE